MPWLVVDSLTRAPVHVVYWAARTRQRSHSPRTSCYPEANLLVDQIMLLHPTPKCIHIVRHRRVMARPLFVAS